MLSFGASLRLKGTFRYQRRDISAVLQLLRILLVIACNLKLVSLRPRAALALARWAQATLDLRRAGLTSDLSTYSSDSSAHLAPATSDVPRPSRFTLGPPFAAPVSSAIVGARLLGIAHHYRCVRSSAIVGLPLPLPPFSLRPPSPLDPCLRRTPFPPRRTLRSRLPRHFLRISKPHLAVGPLRSSRPCPAR